MLVLRTGLCLRGELSGLSTQMPSLFPPIQGPLLLVESWKHVLKWGLPFPPTLTENRYRVPPEYFLLTDGSGLAQHSMVIKKSLYSKVFLTLPSLIYRLSLPNSKKMQILVSNLPLQGWSSFNNLLLKLEVFLSLKIILGEFPSWSSGNESN